MEETQNNDIKQEEQTSVATQEGASYVPQAESLLGSLPSIPVADTSSSTEAEVIKPFLVAVKADEVGDFTVASEEVAQDPNQVLLEETAKVSEYLMNSLKEEQAYIKATVPATTPEGKAIHDSLNEEEETFKQLPPAYVHFYTANKGEVPLANLDYSNYNMAIIAKSKGLVDEDGSADWSAIGVEMGKSLVIPLNLFSQVRTVLGIENENINNLDDLRDYINKTPATKRPIIMDKIKDVLLEDSSIDGIQAINIWDKLFSQGDIEYQAWQAADTADDVFTGLGALAIFTGFGAAAAGLALGVKKGSEFVVDAIRFKSSLEAGLDLLAKTDPEKLGEIAGNSEEVKKVAEALGVKPEEVIERASIIGKQVTDPKDRRDILESALKTQHALKNITERVERNPIPELKASELEKVKQDAIEEAQKELGDIPIAVRTVDMKEADAGGLSVEITLSAKAEDGSDILIKKEKPVTIDDIEEGFDIKTMRTGGIFSKLLSPVFNTDANKELRGVINSNRKNIYSTQIYTEYLGRRYQQIAGTLGKKSRIKFHDAVVHWTTKNKKPTIDDLMSEGLTKDEAKAVIKFFHTTEDVYHYADQQLITEAKTFGFKTIKVGDGDPYIGKVLEDPEKAAKYYKSRTNKYGRAIAIELEDGSVKNLKIPKDTKLEDVLRDAESQGYKLTRLKDPMDTADGTASFYVLVKQDKIGEIPSSGLLKKVENYAPLVVDNSVGVLVKRKKIDLNGSTVYKNEIVGYFDDVVSLKEARRKYNNKDILKNGKKVGAYQVYSFHDEVPTSILKDVTEGIFTGKYRSERTGNEIKKLVYDAEKDTLVKTAPNYKDPLEAMSEYTKTLMKEYNFSPRILADQKRYLNTVAAIVDDFEPVLDNFSRETIMDALNRINPTKLKNLGMEGESIASVKAKLMRAFETLEATSMMVKKNPIQQAFVNAIDDAELGKDVNSLINKLRNGLSQKIAQSDPASFLKSATAIMYLGLYNIRQFFTQSANIINILSISPIHGMKGAFKSGELAVYDMAGGISSVLTEGWVGRFALAEQLLKNSNMSKAEKKESVVRMALWARTGLRENMLANADFFDQREAVSFEKLRQYLSGKTAATLGKVSKKAGDPSLWYSTIFDNMFIYKAGESWNRRVAFSTAFEEAKEKFSLKRLEAAAKGKDKEVIDFIFNRSHTLMFNLDVANRAPFQHGWPGLFLMFYQVNTKTAEALFGRDLSTAEKVRLFGANLAMFGRKGVTGYQGTVSAIAADGSQSTEMDFITSVAEQLGISPEEARTLYTYGLLGVLSKHTLGTAVDFSSLSAIDSLIGTVKLPAETISALLGEEGNGRPVLVPFSAGKQVYTSVGRAVTIIRMAKEKEEITMDDIELLLKELAQIPSSTKNALMAYAIYNTGMYRTSTGNPVMYTDNPKAAAIAQTFGFKLADIEAAYQGLADERKLRQLKRDVSDKIVHTILTDNPESPERVNKLLRAWGRLLGSMREDIQVDIWEMVSKKLTRDPKVNSLSYEILENIRQQINDYQSKGEDNGR